MFPHLFPKRSQPALKPRQQNSRRWRRDQFRQLAQRQLSVEPLEDRRLLAVNVLETGVDTVATEGANLLEIAPDSYQVSLDMVPLGDVEVTVTSDTETEVSSDGINFFNAITLTFDSDQAQTVFVAANDDGAIEGDHTGMITQTITDSADLVNFPLGTMGAPVTVNITDNDGVTITESGGMTLVSEDGVTEDTYTINLDQDPLGNEPVEVTVTADAQVLVSSNGTDFFPTLTLTFTDTTTQTVTVRAFNDSIVEGNLNHVGTITHAITATNDAAAFPTSLSILPVNAAITDNDQSVVGLDAANDLVLTDQNAHNDTLVISESAANVIRIHDPSNPLTAGTGVAQVDANTIEIAVGNIAGGNIRINAGAGNDMLTIDLTNPLTVPIIYDGQTQTTMDALTLQGGGAFTNVDHRFDDASTGAVMVTGNATITYTGLEPVMDNLNAVNRSFTFTGGAETITLSDDGAANGMSQIDSTLGEVVTFVDPTNSLTINAGTGIDMIILDGVDPAFPAGMINVNGNEENDLFDINFDPTATLTIDGNAGMNAIDIAGVAGAQTINLQSSMITGLGGFMNVTSFTGDNTADILVGPNAVNSWNITDANDGNLTGGPSFTNIPNLTAGTDTDLFHVAAAGSLSGTIDGTAAGADTIDIADVAGAQTVNLATSSIGVTVNAFTSIEVFTGDDVADVISGANVANIWNITGANDGNITGGPTYSNFLNLVGGSNDDTFTVTTGSQTGSISGGGQVAMDTLDYAGNGGTAVNVNLATGAATSTGGISGIENLIGSTVADTLVGANDANDWMISAANSGSVDGFTFSSIENITGGTNDDTFRFTGGLISGLVAGSAQTGKDTLDYSANGGVAVNVNLQTSTATSTGGFSGIENVVGSTVIDTLVGENNDNTWTISAANGGMVDGFMFSEIENLTGGTANDSFAFTTGSVSGMIDGGGQTTADTLDYTGNGGGAVNVDLQAGTATSTGGISDIEALIGSTVGDTFVGENNGNTWTIDGMNSGNVDGFAFTGVENVVGGTDIDTFNFTDTGVLTGSVTGGDGIDSLVGDADGNEFTITGANTGTLTGKTSGWSSVENLTGGSMADTFTFAIAGLLSGAIAGGGGSDTIVGDDDGNAFAITAADAGTLTGKTSGWSSIENLTGGAIADTFAFEISGLLSGAIAGGGGSDTILGDDDGNAFGITAADAGTLTGKTSGWSSVENLMGGSMSDTFTFAIAGLLTGAIDGGAGSDTIIGDNDGNAFTVTAGDTGTLTGKTSGWSGVENLTGGSMVDTFTFADAGTLAGAIAGGAGSDTVVGDNDGNAFAITAADAGTLTGKTSGWSSVENLTGGTMVDTFTFANAGLLAGAIAGGAGSDMIVGDDDGNAFGITAADAGTLTGKTSGWTSIENLTGGTMADVFTFANAGLLTGAINGAGGSDTIIGDNDGNLFTVTGSDAGTLTGKTSGWSAVENLTGGTMVDTFTFTNPGVLAGAIDGGADSDMIVGDDDGNEFTATAANAGSLTGKTSGWSNVENLTGGAGLDGFTFTNAGSLLGAIDGAGGTTDKVTGDDDGNSFSVTGANSGALTGKTSGWSNIENLTGGDGVDIITFANAGSLIGAVDGEDGADDKVAGDNDGNEFIVTAANQGNLTGKTSGWMNIENLDGGTSMDVFRFQTNGTIDGAADGGAMMDTIDYTMLSTTRDISLNAMGGVDGFNGTDGSVVQKSVGAFRNIDVMNAGTASNDRLNGLNSASTWTIDDAAGDNYQSGGRNLMNTSFERSQGGADVDTFNVQTTLTVMPQRNVNGGAGDDQFNISPAGTLNDIQKTVQIDGGGTGNMETVRTGAGTLVPNNPVTQATKYIEDPNQSLNRGDRVVVNDANTAATEANGQVVQLSFGSNIIKRGPDLSQLSTLLELEQVGLIDYEGNLGNETVYVNLPSLGFSGAPLIFTIDGNIAGANLIIEGSEADDFIVIEEGINVGNRAPFEVDNVGYIQVHGKGGNDVIINNTSKPSLLDGGNGHDVLVGGSNVDLLIGGDASGALNASNKGSDALFGNAGDDFLFPDLDLVDIKPASSPVPASSFCETVGTLRICVTIVVTPNDLLSGGSGTDSGVAQADSSDLDKVDQLAQMGGTLITNGGVALNVLDWLNARFESASVGSIKSLFQDALQSYAAAGGVLNEFPTPKTGGANPEGEFAVLHNPVIAEDVNDDGHIAPGDVLHVINELNAVGSYEVGNRPGAEGEAGTHAYLDTTGDNHISSADALSIINFLNSLPEGGMPGPIVVGDSEGEGEGAASLVVVSESEASDAQVSLPEIVTRREGSTQEANAADPLPELIEMTTVGGSAIQAPADSGEMDWAAIENDELFVDDELLELLADDLDA